MPLTRSLLFSISILIISCGMGFASDNHVTNKDAGKTSPTVNNADTKLRSTLKDARVAFEWQKWLLRELESNHQTYKQAWAVFSEGGWSNNGQTMILERRDGSVIMRVVHPERKDPEAAIVLSPDKWKQLHAKIKETQNLTSIEKMVFDAVEYEFVAFKKRSQPTPEGRWFVQKRIYLKALPSEDTKPQNDLMMAFVNLRKEYQQKP